MQRAAPPMRYNFYLLIEITVIEAYSGKWGLHT